MLRQCNGQQSAYSFNWFHQWDGVGVSGVWMFLVPFCEKNLEKLKSLCSLSRLHVAYLESRKVP